MAKCYSCGIDLPEADLQTHLQTAHILDQPVKQNTAGLTSTGSGFFGSLFNLSFDQFITPKLIKVLYALSIAISAIWALVLVAAAFNQSSGLGIVMLLIGAPLFFLLSVIYVRVLLELAIVLFKIEQHTDKLER